LKSSEKEVSGRRASVGAKQERKASRKAAARRPAPPLTEDRSEAVVVATE
jgi:hypothetical protein